MQHQKTLQVGCTTSMTSQRRSPLLNIFLFFIFFFVPSRLFAQHAAYFFSFQIFILCTIGQAPIVIFDLLHFISSTIKKVEESLQIHHTMSFPDFHVDWMSPEEVYLHRENTSSQLYRGNSIHHLRCYLQYVVALLFPAQPLSQQMLTCGGLLGSTKEAAACLPPPRERGCSLTSIVLTFFWGVTNADDCPPTSLLHYQKCVQVHILWPLLVIKNSSVANFS